MRVANSGSFSLFENVPVEQWDWDYLTPKRREAVLSGARRAWARCAPRDPSMLDDFESAALMWAASHRKTVDYYRKDSMVSVVVFQKLCERFISHEPSELLYGHGVEDIAGVLS